MVLKNLSLSLKYYGSAAMIILLSTIIGGFVGAITLDYWSRKMKVDPYTDHRYIEVDGHEYITFPHAHDSITHSPKCKCLVPQKPIPAPAPTPSPAKPNRKVNLPDKQGKTHYIMPTVEVTK